MAPTRRIHLIIALFLPAVIQSHAQGDSLSLEQQSSIDIAEFLATGGASPLIIISFSIETSSQSPCKVDMVWDTNENETHFDRYSQGYHPQPMRGQRRGMRNEMLRTRLRGEFRSSATTGDNRLNTMYLYREASAKQKQREGEVSSVSSEYGVEKMIAVSPDGNCSIFRSRLTNQESHFDFRVKGISLTGDSELTCLESAQEIMTKGGLQGSRFTLPSKQQIDKCRAECLKHSSCNPAPQPAA
uniref:Putative lipocalin-3 1 n=1 Tax=Amblyomma triste TaxID=251400 RepID=A0A023GB62_AMBTT